MPRPFLRWVGGKSYLEGMLRKCVPNLEPYARYYEPFFGAGHLFFALEPCHAVIGDLNADLMQCLLHVRNRPDLVWRYLRLLQRRQTSREYYTLRDEFNESHDSARRAALFIYLNKTCFNGIWRVNRSGHFNVPYGAKERAGFPDLLRLESCSKALGKAKLRSYDFEKTVADARAGDFVYFDPPYLPLSPTAYFRHYTSTRFGPEDHERVASVCWQLASEGVDIMVSEGDSALIRKLYREFYIRPVDVRRSVSCESVRVRARELIISSFRP